MHVRLTSATARVELQWELLRMQSVQKPQNQEPFSIRFAAAKDFVTDLVVFTVMLLG